MRFFGRKIRRAIFFKTLARQYTINPLAAYIEKSLRLFRQRLASMAWRDFRHGKILYAEDALASLKIVATLSGAAFWPRRANVNLRDLNPGDIRQFPINARLARHARISWRLRKIYAKPYR
jgi:hypothetical protein